MAVSKQDEGSSKDKHFSFKTILALFLVLDFVPEVIVIHIITMVNGDGNNCHHNQAVNDHDSNNQIKIIGAAVVGMTIEKERSDMGSSTVNSVLPAITLVVSMVRVLEAVHKVCVENENGSGSKNYSNKLVPAAMFMQEARRQIV